MFIDKILKTYPYIIIFIIEQWDFSNLIKQTSKANWQYSLLIFDDLVKYTSLFYDGISSKDKTNKLFEMHKESIKNLIDKERMHYKYLYFFHSIHFSKQKKHNIKLGYR